jgi:equilibrative nucleoside transporter 1/2/3
MTALVINVVVFMFLAMSTKLFLGVSAGVYFGFLILMVFCTSLATALCQNGIFAYVSGFGREEYTQAIMVGQGVAGVLPCIAQIVSVLSVPKRTTSDDVPQESSTSALAYFLTATVISTIAFLAFTLLLSRHGHGHRHKPVIDAMDGEDDLGVVVHASIPLMTLFWKLKWLAGAVFLTFGITMFFPVFTQQVESVRPVESSPRLFQPASFIPLAFLFWNVGDLVGRLAPAIPALSLTQRPPLLFIFATCRIVFIPLYLLCNIRGRGATIASDTFYLLVVQVLFGFTNGYLGANCMMGFVEWVDVDEREAAGGFMSLSLVAGLSVGSLLSFLATAPGSHS